MDKVIHNPLFLNRVLACKPKPLREARSQSPIGFFLQTSLLPRSLYPAKGNNPEKAVNWVDSKTILRLSQLWMQI